MRLTLVISSLSCGGAERVLSILANAWAEKGWRVTILTFDDGLEPPFYELHTAIERHSLGIAGLSGGAVDGVRNNLERIRVLRRAIHASRPLAVISFMDQTNVLAVLASFASSWPVIVCEHNSPAHYFPGRSWVILRRLVYPFASRIVVLTQPALTYFSGTARRHACVIPNPVIVPEVVPFPRREEITPRPRRLIALGRLCEQKGFDVLLRAFAPLAQRHGDWSLVIWGEGPARGEIEALRDELGLREKVLFPGQTKDPFGELRRSDLFVLSSRFEGFPMALCEAMACGLPVVSFDCPTGPSDIIRDGIDGILVPQGDVEALGATLDRLLSDAELRTRLASRAPEVAQRFGLSNVLAMWQDLLQRVA